jgi:magnesium transporter
MPAGGVWYHTPGPTSLSRGGGAMRELTVCTRKGEFEVIKDWNDLHIDPTNLDHVLWLDLVAPDADDFAMLRDRFHFHPLALEDVSRNNQRPKVESYQHYYFAVFYSVEVMGTESRFATRPLYLFIGPNYLVTVHPEPIRQIQETVRRWRDPRSPLGQDLGALVYALLDAIVDDYFPVIDHVSDLVDDLEVQIFEHYDQDALQQIFSLKKDLLAMRRVVAPERDVLNVMLRREIPVFDQQDMAYLQDVYDHIVRITDSLDTYRELLSSALDTFLSVQSNRLNQLIKVLTITSIILMSVTLVAGIYGMNFVHMPELAWRYGYLWALGLMVTISGALIFWFRRLNWL